MEQAAEARLRNAAAAAKQSGGLVSDEDLLEDFTFNVCVMEAFFAEHSPVDSATHTSSVNKGDDYDVLSNIDSRDEQVSEPSKDLLEPNFTLPTHQQHPSNLALELA